MKIIKAIGVAILTWIAIGIVAGLVMPLIFNLLGLSANFRAIGEIVGFFAMVFGIICGVVFYKKSK